MASDMYKALVRGGWCVIWMVSDGSEKDDGR